MIINKSISEPIQNSGEWNIRWGSLQAGLITSWNCGRQMAIESPELAKDARKGRLISLPWKGGLERKTKVDDETKKEIQYGSLFYLAMWQGLRGEDLDIDLDTQLSLKCSDKGITVLFTKDTDKLIRP